MGKRNFPSGEFKINGQELKETYHNGWRFVELESIDKVEQWVAPTKERIGFKLTDISLKSDSIPEYLTLEDVDEYWDEDDGRCWSNYSKIKSLYEDDYKEIPETWEEVEFESECLGELEISNPTKIKDRSYKVYKTKWVHEGDRVVKISDVARWTELEKMLTPDCALHDRPCSISSKQTYDIIRHYVKENIDPKQAEVTSDYDFCFTVKKKIAVKPYIHKWETKKNNGKSYRPPRINTKSIEHKSVEIFEMTHDVKGYRGYTVIKGFEGDDLQNLIDNVKNYLDELIYHVNVPVKECEHCGGTGHIVENNFKINKR